MICFPNAKINLGLNVVSKREDGYHNLETIFYPLPIKDALEIIEAKEQTADTLFETGLKVEADPEKNIVMKAVRLMRKQYHFPYVDIHLFKNIPFGAGLGGGSADASFTLKLLNEKFNLGASNVELAQLALSLGADCPFFIYNKPLFASGIGEVFEEVDLNLSGYSVLLIKPDIHVSTKDAFSLIKPSNPVISLTEVVTRPLEEWKTLMVNDFEKSVFSKYPQISNIKQSLYDIGAVYASMSGSGSSVYGIFNSQVEIQDASFSGCFVEWICLS